MTDVLAKEQLQKWMGKTFSATPLASQTALKLVEISDPTSQAKGFECFSLEFLGPLDRLLPQATYQLKAEQLELELFLVPVEKSAEGYRYQAVINRECAG